MYSPQFSPVIIPKKPFVCLPSIVDGKLNFVVEPAARKLGSRHLEPDRVLESIFSTPYELFHCGTGAAAGGPTMAGSLFHLTSSRIEVRKARGQTLLVPVCSGGSLSSLIFFGRLRDHQLQPKPPSGLLAPSSPWRFPRAENIQFQHTVISVKLSIIHLVVLVVASSPLGHQGKVDGVHLLADLILAGVQALPAPPASGDSCPPTLINFASCNNYMTSLPLPLLLPCSPCLPMRRSSSGLFGVPSFALRST